MKFLANLTGKNHITMLKSIYRQKRTTVLSFAISCPLIMITPTKGFAHSKSCELTSDTAEAIMVFNACKAETQATQFSGHSEMEAQHVLEDEMTRLRAENTILRKQLDDVRSMLFELLQKVTTK